MDIDILLSLQDFRNGAGGFLTEFLSKMTFLAELNSAIGNDRDSPYRSPGAGILDYLLK